MKHLTLTAILITSTVFAFSVPASQRGAEADPAFDLADWVEHVVGMGLTGGCGPSSYCPDAPINRGQMAVFLLSALKGVGYLPPPCQENAELFDDVPAGNPFCPWIEELANRGITSGCGSGNYCPSIAVNRGQITVFLLTTFEPEFAPPACQADEQVFGDVAPDNPFCPWIQALHSRGVAFGCGGGNFCPGDPWTRGQMAVFLLRMLSIVPEPCVGLFADVPCFLFRDRFEDSL